MRVIFSFLFLCFVAPAQVAKAQDNLSRANLLVADLGKDAISIRSDFSGEKLLLFGAVRPTSEEAQSDIVVVLRGPALPFMVRKKTNQAGIWVNSNATAINDMPAFYAVVSNAPLERIVPEPLRAKYRIGISHLESNAAPEFVRALKRLRQEDGLYSEGEGEVELIGGQLFRAEINLPPAMPIGTYVTEFFAFQNGRLVGYQTGGLPVDIVGAGHFMFQAAHNTPLLYGISGVALAVLLGALAAAAFRRRA